MTVLMLLLLMWCLCPTAGSISAAWVSQLVNPQSGFLISCWMWPGTRASAMCVNHIQFTGRWYQLPPGETHPPRCDELTISATKFRGPGWATTFHSSLGKLEQHSHGLGEKGEGWGKWCQRSRV